ncbi:MAG: glycosyltransferase [bacterium]
MTQHATESGGSAVRGQGGAAGPGAHVTAILPLKHYHPSYLEQCLASLFGQSRAAWQAVVVVEPGELSDFSQLLAAALADPRLRLVANEGRKLAGAVNTGMRHARTEFVALLLGDDLWAPNAVAVLSAAITAEPAIDFFHSARRVVDDNGLPISSVLPSRAEFTLADFVNGSPVKHLLCWRRELGLAVGGLDERLNSVGPDDYDFPWIMAERGARFRALDDCLYYYRDHRAGFRLTTHLPLSVHQRECDRILRKHGVAPLVRRAWLDKTRHSYMRQCLYRNSLDRWIKQWLGWDARRGWRDTYR